MKTEISDMKLVLPILKVSGHVYDLAHKGDARQKQGLPLSESIQANSNRCFKRNKKALFSEQGFRGGHNNINPTSRLMSEWQ